MTWSPWPARFAAAVAAGAVAGTALAAGMEPAAPVSIESFSFKPGDVTVAAGARIAFVNHDDVPHSVVIPDAQVNSGILDTDGRYEAVLAKPGTYVFFCGLHPMMKGKITVTDK